MRLEALLPRQSDNCIQCPSTPACNCAAGQQCFIISRGCNTCATIKCVSSGSSGGGGKGGVSKGALAGAVLGSLIFLAIAVTAFLWYRRRLRAKAGFQYDVKPDVPAAAADVLNRPDPTEKPATPTPQAEAEPHIVRIYASPNTTIDLDPQSTNSPLHSPSRHSSTQSNPFSDNHSIQTAGTESTNVIPIALVSPEHMSTADSASTGPTRPPRSPDLNLEHVNVSRDSLHPASRPYAASQRSGASGLTQRNSYMSGASFASDLLNEAPVIITPVKGNVRLVKAEVINAGSLSPASAEGSFPGRRPAPSPLASTSFGPSDVVTEEDEPRDPFRDGGSSPSASVTTFGHGAHSPAPGSMNWTPDTPHLPWARSNEARPSSLSTQAGSVIDIASATRVNVGLATPSTAGFPRSPYRTTMGKLVSPHHGAFEEQQQQALGSRSQPQPVRRISNSSVLSAASTRADSILESFPFVPPSPISDRPLRSPPASPLAQQSFAAASSESPLKRTDFSKAQQTTSDAELPPPPSRRTLGLSTASQFSTASSGLGSFPFQIDSGNGIESHPPTSFSGRQRASLDTLALTSDLSSFPLGFDRESVSVPHPQRDNKI